jgi:hypothetical protein
MFHLIFLKYIALRTLGFNDFEKNPEGKEEDKIKLDVFLKEA